MVLYLTCDVIAWASAPFCSISLTSLTWRWSRACLYPRKLPCTIQNQHCLQSKQDTTLQCQPDDPLHVTITVSVKYYIPDIFIQTGEKQASAISLGRQNLCIDLCQEMQTTLSSIHLPPCSDVQTCHDLSPLHCLASASKHTSRAPDHVLHVFCKRQQHAKESSPA